MAGILGAISRALGNAVTQVRKKANAKISTQPIQQIPIVQQPIMQQPIYPDFSAQMQQMQDMYNKQMQDFQAQTQKQQLTTNYTNQNQQNINKSVQGTLGGGVGYQPQQVKQGAHIKQSTGTQGAVSRYLATDIWKNK